MPKISGSKKQQRKERIILIVQSQPLGISEAEVAEEMGMSGQRRTINNYLRELEREGWIYKEDQRTLWLPLRPAKLRLAYFDVSPEEAMTLYLAVRLLAKQQDQRNEAAETALLKLSRILTTGAGVGSEIEQAAKELTQRREAKGYEPTFRRVMQGYIYRRKLKMVYRPYRGKAFETYFATYLLEPSAIGFTTYLIGHSSLPNAIRHYKLERIQSVELTREEYALPAEFPGLDILREAWSIIGGDQSQNVILRFSPQVAERVLETEWHPSQKHEWDADKAGYLRWSVEVADTRDMLPWIRGWGADVEVLAPQRLRAVIEQHVVRLNEIYGASAVTGTAPIAHTVNDRGERHPLVTHLQAVADMAGQFAAPLQARELARYLGMWHDLGKFHPDFQQYLFEAEAGIRRRGPDHKAAGVRVAQEQRLGYVALLLQGHHGGLKNAIDLQLWYERCRENTEEALSLARVAVAFEPSEPLPLPSFARNNAHSAEFFLRMLFSALVDADFLDTEAHFNPAQSVRRRNPVDMAILWRRFADDQQRRFGEAAETMVNRSRQEIYEACLEAAAQPAGLFRLTVPTGGGKTRSGMAFALRHALQHGQRRVVVVVPYITITQQTAAVYRDIFNAQADDEPVVLEHHSGTKEWAKEADDYSAEEIWQRLSAENWDAPIIVTTTVQLFESLFANSTSRCRKLHRLANSVIILDEAQSLPVHLLEPMLDALQELGAHYGSTVVLSTATQPAFDSIASFKELAAREIVPMPERHFQALKRVHYEWRVQKPLSWPEVADLMRSEAQALAICNTKQDALDLLQALDDPEALHLSTLLCGAHRSAVIKEVTGRLKAGRPCRLVATQVVEAGVDIDFPLVLRALGPLDSIVQAAGRANREGRLESGRVIIFSPAEGRLPPGAYKRATQTTQTILNAGPLNLDDPAAIRRYFEKLYPLEDTDGKEIQKMRKELDYPEVARRFRMIDDDTVSVIITTYGDEAARRRVSAIVDRLRSGAPPSRQLLRQLQPYTVSIWKNQADKYLNQGFLSPRTAEGIPPGIWEWTGEYDRVRGLSATDIDADQLVF